MNEVPPTDDGSLPLANARHVDEICDHFEDAWVAGQRPNIDDYLVTGSDVERPLLLRELLRLELEYRHKKGEKPTQDEYVSRFPEHAELLSVLLSQRTASTPHKGIGENQSQPSSQRQSDSTSMSLLQRLRQSPGEQDWARFVQLYTPLIYSWARRVSLQPQDAADLVQDVFVILLRKLPELDYDRHKSFRSWLLTVTLNRWRDLCRRRACRPQEANPVALPNDIACPDGNELFSEAEYRQYLVARALKLMQTQFQPITWKACWEHVVSGRPAAEVAKELGITENAVYLAKGRVLRRLRDELTGLLE